MLSGPAKHGDHSKLLVLKPGTCVVTKKSLWQYAAAMTSATDSTASITQVEQWADLPFYL